MRPHPGSCRRELGLEYLFRIFIFFLFCPPPRGLWLHLHLFLRAIVTLLLPLSAGRGGIASARRPAGPLRLAAVSGLYGWRTQRMRCLALLTSLLNTSAVSVVVNVKVQASEDFRSRPAPYSEPLQ